MLGRIASLFLLTIGISTAALAEDVVPGARTKLGYGLVFVNDQIGDGKDRWRTGSVASSRVWGVGWQGKLPQQPGEILEFRFLAEVMSPENIVNPAIGDRPYAGTISLGLHTHFETAGGIEMALGGDLVVIGPQTRVDEFQTAVHDVLGMASASAATLNAQIADQIRPTATLEMARDFGVGASTSIRPFAELRGGVETYARVGFDVRIGSVGQGELLTRDPVTGHRIRVVRDQTPGMAFVIGADVAKVWESTYLPESRGFVLSDSRARARLGLHWQGEENMIFYGLTWLGEEFEGQNGTQVVAALQFSLNF